MKQLLLAISAILLLSACTQEKIAYVDIEKIYKEYNKAKEAEQEMSMQSQKMSTEIEELRASFQQKVQEYQSSSSTLSEKDKQQKEQELMREQQEIQQKQQMARQQMQEESKNKMDKLDENIESFISEYASSNGFTLVLGTSSQTKSVLYANSSKNITEEIIESLNDDNEPEENTEEATE